MGSPLMKKKSSKISLFVTFNLLLVLCSQNIIIRAVDAKNKVHIVYMGEKHHHDPEVVTCLHHDMLASVVGSKEAATDAMVYSYKQGFSSFAAKFTESQAQKIADTGIWPESDVFNDEDLGPIPNQWKGQCVSGQQFNASKACNNKLIGVKYYIDGCLAENEQSFNTADSPDFLSPRDAVGHGTHTSTIAGGSFVHNASYKGLGLGIVRGGAPHARLAHY